MGVFVIVKNELIQGDCLKIIPQLSEDSVDLVFGSPPYENARDVKSDPFPVLKGQEWVDWMISVYKESLRVCKGLVAFVVQGRTQNYRWSATPCLLAADLCRAGICLRDFVIYHRIGIPGSGGPDWLRHDCEYILCATNGGKLPWSDNTACGNKPKWGPGGEMSHRLSSGARVNQWGGSEGKKRYGRKQNGTIDTNKRPSHIYTLASPNKKVGSPRRSNGEREVQQYVPPVKANPGNLISCGAIGGGRMGSNLAHENEAPFPEKLAEFMIKTFCKPGGAVLDPFCGSGTTCAVAKKLGRQYIGIDIRQSQTDLSKRRLSDV